jgi:hypothetical protein
MSLSSVELRDYINGAIFNGVKSGSTKAFVIEEHTRQRLLQQDPSSNEVIHPTVDGDDIRRFNINFRGRYLIYLRWTDRIGDYPAIERHLSQFRTELERRDGTKENGPWPWYALSRPRPESGKLYSMPKILYPDISSTSRFCLDVDGLFPGNTAYCIPGDDLYLLGVLNSEAIMEVVRARFACLGDPERGGRFRFFRQSVEHLPIPAATPADRSAVASLVKSCIDARKRGESISEQEQEINARVSRLFGLEG